MLERLLGCIATALVVSAGEVEDKVCPNFQCKNATSDWPPCRPPTQDYSLRFGKGSADGRLPITAWWGPVGYGGNSTSQELRAYAAAGFTIALVSDRGDDRCTEDFERDARESWQFIVQNIQQSQALGLQALVDTYRCRPWGGMGNIGGLSQGPVGQRVPRTANHKITLPEVRWLANQLTGLPSAVGLLITDDGADLAKNEVEEVEWMRKNTPQLFPWINQCADGSEWLARAGTPYAVPELYSVRGPGGNATAMAAAQLNGYDTWMGRSQRFGLVHWPLINVGDGGDTGLVRSESLTRFSAYSSLAYGAKGINWYCWGNGIWNLTKQVPTPIYSSVTSVNRRVNAGGWAENLLNHTEWEGSFHTGWAGPKYSSWEVGPGMLIEHMDDDLLAGVMSDPQNKSSVLVLVVDKRLTVALTGPPKRSARVKFNGDLVSEVHALPGGEYTVSADGVSVTASLEGGEGVLLRLGTQAQSRLAKATGTATLSETPLSAAARALRRWRYGPVPSLSSVRTTQFQFYGQRPGHLQQWGGGSNAATAFVLGCMDVTNEDPESRVLRYAAAGFNTLAAYGKTLYPMLNAGLRRGLFVLAGADLGTGEDPMSASEAAVLLEKVGCHPNLGGMLLAREPVHTHADQSKVATIAKQLRHDASTLLAVAPMADVDSVVAADETDLPLATLVVPRNASASVAEQMVSTVSSLADLVRRRAGQSPQRESSVSVTIYSGDAVYIRFAAFAAVAFGANSLFYKGLDKSQGGFEAAADAVGKISQWADRLSRPGTALVGLISSGPKVAGGLPLPPPQYASLVTHLEADLLVGVFADGTGDDIPLLLVVDTRSGGSGGARAASIGFDGTKVAGWTSLTGNDAAGFGSCANKMVLGPEARLDYAAAGDAVLLTVTLYEPE